MEVVPGIPMLEMVWRKVRLSLLLDEIIVTTPDPFLRKWAAVVAGMKVEYWAGERNVLAEIYYALEVNNAHYAQPTIVRITADCPLIRPEIIDNCVQEFLDRDVDLVYNSFEDTGADGSDVEVFSMSALEQANKYATEREHPTVWMRSHLKTHYVETPFTGCSVDTMEDLQKVRQIFREGELR